MKSPKHVGPIGAKKDSTTTPCNGNDPHGSDENFIIGPKGQKWRRCVAKSKRSQQRCNKAAVPGRNVCHLHGGKSLSGPAHPSWKSKVDRYVETFGIDPESIAAEAELQNQNPEIAALDQRIINIANEVRSNLSPASVIYGHFQLLEFAMKSEDTAAMRVAFSALKDSLTRNAGADRQWRTIERLLDTKRKLIESERKRALEQQLYLTREQAATFGRAILEAVARHVHDRAAIVRISNDIRLLNDSLSTERSGDEPERVQ
jgi:hypothetical protein